LAWHLLAFIIFKPASGLAMWKVNYCCDWCSSKYRRTARTPCNEMLQTAWKEYSG